MPHATPAPLLAALPSATAKALGKALADPKRSAKKLSAAFVKALREASFPHAPCITVGKLTVEDEGRARGVMPLPSTLTPAQRALAELAAYEDGLQLFFFDDRGCRLFSLPESAGNRRRWLGIDPGGALEAPMADGVPRWHAVQRAAFEDRRVGAFFQALPARERLEILGALHPPSYGLGIVSGLIDACLDAATVGIDDAASFAPAFADRLLTLPLDARSIGARAFAFRMLMHGHVPLEPRWDRLLPLLGQPQLHAEMRRWFVAIPPERREAALIAAMRDDALFDTMLGARALLDDAPSARVAELLYARTEAGGRRAFLEALEALATRHPTLRDALAKIVSRPSVAVELARGAASRPAGVDALSASRQRQLRAFGVAYDGENLTAKARLDPAKEMDGGSFAGVLEIVELVDARTGALAYEAFLAGDSGSVFRAGKTEQVAAIVQFGLEGCRDEALHAAIERALGTPRG